MGARRWRIGLLLFVLYVVAFADRANIGMAAPSLAKAYVLGPAAIGFLTSFFFYGYLVMGIPGGLLAQRFSARRYMTIGMVVWGLAAMVPAVAGNYTIIAISRIILGLAEGGIFPAAAVLIGQWFPRDERGRAASSLIIASPIAVAISSPIGGWLIQAVGWRGMFFWEGIPALIVAAIFYVVVRDRPEEDTALGASERTYLKDQATTEDRDNAALGAVRWRVIMRRPVVVSAIVYLLWLTGLYGLTLWLPTYLKTTTHDNILTVGLLTALPWAVAAVALGINAVVSDHRTMIRRFFAAVPLGAGGIALVVGQMVPTTAVILIIVLLAIAAIGVWGPMGPFWGLALSSVPPSYAGATTGIVNTCGNIGGILGPTLVGLIAQATGSDLGGFIVLGLCLLVSGLVLVVFAPAPKRVAEIGAGASAI